MAGFKPKTDHQWQKAVAHHLVGQKIVSVSFMSKTEAEEWGWYNRPIQLMLSDGHQLLISQDDEGNDGGSIFTSYKDLPIIPTLR